MTTVDSHPGVEHLNVLVEALDAMKHELGRLRRWADELSSVLLSGGRLLAVGNGGSAAQAQHLTSELVGRYCKDRRPFSALALHADGPTVTAISNDYGVREMFARQVQAHGRAGDVLMVFSTSGRSANVLAALKVGKHLGLQTWALTGRMPNTLALASDDAFTVDAISLATVQEVHLVAIHVLCELLDAGMPR